MQVNEVQGHAAGAVLRPGHSGMESYESSTQNQYLVFTLGGKRYGVDLTKIQEIREWEEPTSMPGTAEEIKGVLDLRGIMVPVVDLRLRFQLVEAEFTRETVIIVTLIRGKAIGLVVDSVSDVISLAEGQFKQAPSVEGFDADHMKGIATLQDGMIILLNVDKLLSADTLQLS